MRFTYPYVSADPPAPFVLVDLARHDGANLVPSLPAKVDSGADRTIIPAALAARLGLEEVERLVFAGLGGEPVELPVFHVRLRIHNLAPIAVDVAASDGEPHVLLGRDVLNRYKIVLDGPNLRLEIG
jgi:predicted aspartyl protease